MASMNKLPAMWNHLVNLLAEYKDVAAAVQRAREAKDNSQVMQPLSILRRRLQADGLWDKEGAGTRDRDL